MKFTSSSPHFLTSFFLTTPHTPKGVVVWNGNPNLSSLVPTGGAEGMGRT
jgi:hypothetical protein